MCYINHVIILRYITLQIVEKDCRARGLNREDAMDRARWRKLIGMIDDYDESSG